MRHLLFKVRLFAGVLGVSGCGFPLSQIIGSGHSALADEIVDTTTTLYNGETVPFASGSPFDSNGSTIVQTNSSPHSAPNHLRATIKVRNWWGAVAYFPAGGNVIDFSSGQTLSLYMKSSQAVSVGVHLFDKSSANGATYQASLTRAYNQIRIPVAALAANVNLAQVTAVVISISVSGTPDYLVDIDDLVLTSATPTPPPPAANVQMSVFANQATTDISPYIYGTQLYNTTTWDGSSHNLTFGRYGGNSLSAYNWANNATNAGTDWDNRNTTYGGGNVPGAGAGLRIETARAANAAALVTVPMGDYVAADSLSDQDIGLSPNYRTTRLRANHPVKGAPFTLTPDPANPNVYQDEYANYIVTKYGTGKVFFGMDNEPDGWDTKHPRLRSAKLTYNEYRNRAVATATAIRNVAPTALIFGPALCCYYGYSTLSGAADANGQFFIDYYLKQMQQASTAAGKRLLDVLDLHWYPEHSGSNGIVISSDDASAITAAARMDAPRSLWDATFKENSWIAKDALNGPITLIPSMKAKIAANFPNTGLAFTEYYYGGGADISGGIAQADVLGIFGKQGVFAASLWHLGSTDDRFIYGAFRMYRNYDGANSTFGNASVATQSTDTANFSIYASINSANNKRVLVLINKKAVAQTAAITVTDTVATHGARSFVLTSANPAPVAGPSVTTTNGNILVYSMPAASVTTLELN